MKIYPFIEAEKQNSHATIELSTRSGTVRLPAGNVARACGLLKVSRSRLLRRCRHPGRRRLPP